MKLGELSSRTTTEVTTIEAFHQQGCNGGVSVRTTRTDLPLDLSTGHQPQPEYALHIDTHNYGLSQVTIVSLPSASFVRHLIGMLHNTNDEMVVRRDSTTYLADLYMTVRNSEPVERSVATSSESNARHNCQTRPGWISRLFGRRAWR